jgi:hypothetical protein
MAQASGSTSQEYWRPPNPNLARLFETPAAAVCWRCGMPYAPAARFCQMCGCSLEPAAHSAALLKTTGSEVRKAATWPFLSRLPLPISSFICFVLAIACVAGAASLGAIYKTDSLIDWEAVQIWRIEWLLAALAALLAGLLLKKTEP